MEVFWAKGYEGAQLVDLTAAMGINPPSFYAAFGPKEALFREALDRYLATDGAGSMQALETGATTRESILGMLTASAEIALASPGARGCMLILGLVNGLPENDGLRLHLAGLRRETTERIRRRLRRGVEDGDLPAGTDIDGLATFFGTMLQGLSLQARDGASREQLLAAASAAVKALD
ncbi:TetR/AcrR family transcriptional regulator [Mycobacterium sp. KBS0706]|nr:TetR/AcrR family transcriptional regulator [Mycobacterium sp. KBS0706]